MKRVTKIIGVTLCVAPFFISGHTIAQSGSAEARLLLEVQALRDEVAELRDMVERQAHQLQRMQRQSASAAPATPAQTAPSYSSGSSYVGAAGATAAANTAPAANPGAAYIPPLTDPVAPGPTQSSGAGSAPTPTGSVPPTSNTAPSGGFYRPSSAADSQQVVSAKDVPIDAGQRPVPPINDGYAPVVDRSIGSPGSRAAAPNTAPTAAPADSAAGQQPLSTPTPTLRVAQPATPQNNSVQPGQTVTLSPPSVRDGSTGQAAATVQNNASIAAAGTAGNGPVVSVPNVAAPANAAPAVAPPAPRVLPEQEYYDQGFNLVKQGKFSEAIVIFQQQILQHPQGNLAGDAHYWIGESSFLARDLATSKQYFKLFLDNYPQSARVPGAMLRTAYIEQEQGNLIEARILLNEIIQYHPRSDAVHAAKNRLAALEN